MEIEKDSFVEFEKSGPDKPAMAGNRKCPSIEPSALRNANHGPKKR